MGDKNPNADADENDAACHAHCLPKLEPQAIPHLQADNGKDHRDEPNDKDRLQDFDIKHG